MVKWGFVITRRLSSWCTDASRCSVILQPIGMSIMALLFFIIPEIQYSKLYPPFAMSGSASWHLMFNVYSKSPIHEIAHGVFLGALVT
jgi:hypothetical protein